LIKNFCIIYNYKFYFKIKEKLSDKNDLDEFIKQYACANKIYKLIHLEKVKNTFPLKKDENNKFE
jgi:hypothetical protein